ncbi:MAG: VWA domain-containing protein [Acidobacteria bacterium]|nr:VWA domain-containing protein [Acidobacteriota bacterium]
MEHRKFSLAIAVVMDRSGSMAVEVGGGRTKMDLANLAAVTVLDLLSPTDEFGVIAVDSSSHTILDLKTVDVNARHRQRILQVDSMGGGIFIYEALTAAAEMMLKAKAGARHIILFADAADSEEPGKYQELLARCQEAGITVSVIGLGKPSDVDANLLRDIANRGKGQIFFTENAAELPRLFAQDTIVVARYTFLEDPAQIQFTSGMVMLAGKQFSGPPRIGGFNLTYLRPKANLAAVTTDEYQAPVVASWQAGSGRVLCYTGEADGKFSGAISRWGDVGDFFTSLARWTAGEANNLPGNMLLTQEVNNGISVIKLHLDPERDQQESGASPIISELPKITTLRGLPGARPTSEKAEMRWTSADTLEFAFPLKGNETALSAVEVAGGGRLILAPVTLPYSPEYKPVNVGEGRAALARMAQITGGQERIELAGVWKDMPRKPRLIELAPWFLFPAIILLLAEIFERQTGLITSRMRSRQKERGQKIKTVKKEISPHYPREAPQTFSDVETPETSPQKTEQPEPVSILSALRQARRQAKERTDAHQSRK